jgi:hypothetical protein
LSFLNDAIIRCLLHHVLLLVLLSAAEVDNSYTFVKLLRNLRPSYDWVPAHSSAATPSKAATPIAAAPASAGSLGRTSSRQQQQQQCGHWLMRRIGKDLLKQLKLEYNKIQVHIRNE